MDDTITLTRAQIRVLLAGVGVAAGCVGVTTGRVTVEELSMLLDVFLERVGPHDQEWLLEVAQRVETVLPPGVWH